MLHAGVLKKFGLYGLIRVALPLMPQAAQSWLQVLAWLCLGNLLYAGWVAMRQRDFNLLLGNSSVAHMGFAFLGIASLSLVGLTGAVLVMVAHGLLAALSFGLSGYLRAQTRTLNMDELGGLLGRMPFLGAALVMAALAGCGLPGFANFAGEITVLFGAWKTLPWFVVAAAWGGLVIGALYMLRAVRAILHGEGAERWTAVADANAWRKAPFVLLLAGLIAFGCWPRALTDKIKTAAAPIVKMATAGAASRTADPKAVAQKPAPPASAPRRAQPRRRPLPGGEPLDCAGRAQRRRRYRTTRTHGWKAASRFACRRTPKPAPAAAGFRAI
jgi:NADH-quinone oxidoreductase subunit M